MTTVTEGNMVPVCVRMSSASVAATLGMEVVVTLFTSDGTGVLVIYFKICTYDERLYCSSC